MEKTLDKPCLHIKLLPYFFFLVDLTSHVGPRLLDSLLPFFAIPTHFSPNRNSSCLNICPYTLHHLGLGLPVLLTPTG
jgi:hypothetical protein